MTTFLSAIDTDSEIQDDRLLGTKDRLLGMFDDVDANPEHRYLQSTIERDSTITNKEEAILEFYRRIRPGDPPTLENAHSLMTALFFNSRRYDQGKVGRYKVNRRLGLDIPDDHRTLTREDVVAIVREIVRLNNGVGSPDDIDHLGNRRVRTVGELIQNQFRIGLLRMEPGDPRANDHNGSGYYDPQHPHQHPAGSGGHKGVLWWLPIVAVHGSN